MEQTNIIELLEEKRTYGLDILTQQLAKILNIDEDTLDYMNKCWGYGYVFIKNPSHNWQIQKDVYIEEEWFINLRLN